MMTGPLKVRPCRVRFTSRYVLGAVMARPKFTEEECKKFEEEANPHQWFLTASLLHDQAVELDARRGQGTLAQIGPEGYVLGQWAATDKATFLLCAFALENAIKALLIYEHPAWISDGRLVWGFVCQAIPPPDFFRFK
jgi:hypothetical protein